MCYGLGSSDLSQFQVAGVLAQRLTQVNRGQGSNITMATTTSATCNSSNQSQCGVRGISFGPPQPLPRLVRPSPVSLVLPAPHRTEPSGPLAGLRGEGEAGRGGGRKYREGGGEDRWCLSSPTCLASTAAVYSLPKLRSVWNQNTSV